MGAADFWSTPGGWTLLTVLQILAVLVWILLSLAFLLLAYAGSRFVLEVILHRV